MVDRRQDRNQEATVWVGGIDPQGTEEIIWELMMQCGPVADVTMPRDKVTGTHQGYAFVEYESKEDAEYAQRILNMIKLYGKPLRINKAASDKTDQEEESHAKVFVGNLDPDVDEKVLYDTFSQFGAVLSSKIMTKEESSESKGFGFVVFDSFEAADAAIETMNGQYLAGKPCHTGYAYKKDGKPGERHGSAAEREMARQRKLRQGTNMLKLPPSKDGLNIPQNLPSSRPPPATFQQNIPQPPPFQAMRPPMPPGQFAAPPLPPGFGGFAPPAPPGSGMPPPLPPGAGPMGFAPMPPPPFMMGGFARPPPMGMGFRPPMGMPPQPMQPMQPMQTTDG